MTESFWASSQVMTALFGFGVVVVGAIRSWGAQARLLRARVAADERLAESRFAFDQQLAELRFKFDQDLAKRKIDLDAQLADRKRRQDFAEELLAGFYEVRDVMMDVRSPAGYEGEGKTRQRDAGESEEVGHSKDTYFAILERLKKHSEKIVKVMSRRYKAAALFGPAAAEPFKLLGEALTRVTVSAQMLIRCAGTSDRPPPAKFEQWEADIWWGDDSDKVSAKIEEAIAAIERICRPVLEAQA